jgi:hypothetical protein
VAVLGALILKANFKSLAPLVYASCVRFSRPFSISDDVGRATLGPGPTLFVQQPPFRTHAPHHSKILDFKEAAQGLGLSKIPWYTSPAEWSADTVSMWGTSWAWGKDDDPSVPVRPRI